MLGECDSCTSIAPLQLLIWSYTCLTVLQYYFFFFCWEGEKDKLQVYDCESNDDGFNIVLNLKKTGFPVRVIFTIL